MCLDTVSTTCGSGWVTDQVYGNMSKSSAFDFVPTRYRRWYWCYEAAPPCV